MLVIFVFHKDIRYRLDAVHTGGMEVQRSCRGHVGMSASEPRRIVNMLTCSRTQSATEIRTNATKRRMAAESEQSESNVC